MAGPAFRHRMYELTCLNDGGELVRREYLRSSLTDEHPGAIRAMELLGVEDIDDYDDSKVRVRLMRPGEEALIRPSCHTFISNLLETCGLDSSLVTRTFTEEEVNGYRFAGSGGV